MLWIGICHAVIALPVVLLILLFTLQRVDANLERAAFNSGGGRLRLHLRVVVTIAARGGLVSAALFAFLTSVDELIIALFLTAVRADAALGAWNSLRRWALGCRWRPNATTLSCSIPK
jgi:putative spermidine/putrescine transport system permease protein